jgi:hypothetical protein
LKYTDPSGYKKSYETYPPPAYIRVPGRSQVMSYMMGDTGFRSGTGGIAYGSTGGSVVWQAYISATMSGYTGGYDNFSEKIWGNTEDGSYTIRWETKYMYVSGTKQEIRDNEGNLIEIRLPDFYWGIVRESITIPGTYPLNNPQSGEGGNAIDIASNSIGGVSLLTRVREIIEWEYLSQARINRSISGDFSRPINHSLRAIRGVGTGLTVAGGFIGVVNFGISDKSWGDYGQLGISFLSTGLTLSAPTAPIGIGLGVIDVAGGFNSFYNYLDNQQQFYNNTGGVIVPFNGVPTFIQLRKP